MDEGADRLLLAQTMRFRIGQRIDAVERPIWIRLNRCLQGFDHRRIGGLPQKPKQCFVSHSISSKAGFAAINIGRPASQKKGPAKSPSI